MRTISLRRLREFWITHPAAERPLKQWYKAALTADWSSIRDVRQLFPHADAVTVEGGESWTVFNIGGNKYRLVVRTVYEYRRVYVKHVLTHSEYDRGHWKV